MSRRSSSRYQHQRDGNSSHSIRGRHYQAMAGFTLAHAGRKIRLGPVAFWVVVGTLVVMAVWTITTATYFAFHEDALTRLIARQAEMQFGYEDRIAELRAQVDRISSRQFLDQEQYEQKLDQILRRQAALESRTSTLSGLGDLTGSTKPGARGSSGEPRSAPSKPSAVGDKGSFLLPPARSAASDSHAGLFAKGASGLGGMIARLQASLDRVEQRHAMTLNSIESVFDSKARRIRGVLAELGINFGKTAPAERGMGGPFVPPQQPKDPHAFDRQLQRIDLARAQVNRLRRSLASLPVRQPLGGDVDASSGFGVRSDPFTGWPAMHTGLDMVADPGEPVRATADGAVTTAGWSGGYGKVVDVDHGNGISTRYAHLSAIDVRVGQMVRTGQIVGKVGSSGRSTGPHLHYETRVRGEPVDPQKFLRAGERLQGSL